MKRLVAMVVGTGFGILSPLWGQTGTPAAATAPVPSVSVMPEAAPSKAKAPMPFDKARGRQSKKSAIQETIPAPTQSRRNAAARSMRGQGPAVSYADAVKRQHRQRHDRRWWVARYPTIIFVNGCGYYYWDAGYWFPALGYDPRYESYDYEGPIYTYGELLPDQVIYNVQRALKELGYYSGPLNSSLGPATRAAISAFQEDSNLDATGAIDAPTVEALGLY